MDKADITRPNRTGLGRDLNLASIIPFFFFVHLLSSKTVCVITLEVTREQTTRTKPQHLIQQFVHEFVKMFVYGKWKFG